VFFKDKNISSNTEIVGIFYMLICQFSFATNDALVKIIYQKFDDIFVLNQIIFIRGIFAILFIGIILYVKKIFNFKKLFKSKELILRGTLETFAGLCFFIGIATLPFAKVYILISLAPILLTVFGVIFLKEKVKWIRWAAVIFGFLGVVVVINPQKLEYGFYFIFPLLCAVFICIRDLYTKNMKSNFHSLQIAFMTSFIVTLLFGLLTFYKFYQFSLIEVGILLIASIFLSLGYIFAVATIKVALVSTTSTFRYSVIIWGIIYGYFMFDEIPKLNTFIGGLMIIVSGIIIILREKQLGKIE